MPVGGGTSSGSTGPSTPCWKPRCWRRGRRSCRTRKSLPNTGGWPGASRRPAGRAERGPRGLRQPPVRGGGGRGFGGGGGAGGGARGGRRRRAPGRGGGGRPGGGGGGGVAAAAARRLAGRPRAGRVRRAEGGDRR